MKYINILLLLIIISFMSCEDVSDTYSDVIKKGKTRYIGKCYDLSAKKGWNRIQLNWNNGIDPTIEHIKVKWTSTESKDSILLPKDATTFTTPNNLINKNYEFIVSAVDKNNNESLPVNVYEKPFSEDDELMSALKIIDRKHFYVNNKLVLFLHKADNNILSASMDYYSNNEKKTYNINKEDFKNKILTIEDVDKDRPISIQNSMKIEECIDIINFKPYTLKEDLLSLNSDFLKNLKYNSYNEEIDGKFLKSVTTLYVDCDMNSLEDIAYLPNLKKLVLGSKKYLDTRYVDEKYLFKLIDKDISIFILKMMQEYKDLKIELYGNNFDLKGAEGLQIDENPIATLPEINFFTKEEIEKWKITSNTNLSNISNFEYLFDNDATTFWKPQEVIDRIRNNEIQIDMLEVKDLHGILLSQVDDSKYLNYMPNIIKISLSNDKENWVSPFSYHDIKLGVSPNEKNLIEFDEVKKARYIKLSVFDKSSSSNNYTVIGDFIPY